MPFERLVTCPGCVSSLLPYDYGWSIHFNIVSNFKVLFSISDSIDSMQSKQRDVNMSFGGSHR